MAQALLKRFYDNFEELFCAFLMSVVIVCLGAQVFLRYVFHSSLSWSEELSRICFIWTIYVGAALAAKRQQHVRVTALFLVLPKPLQTALWVLVDVIWMVFNLVFAWQGVLFVKHSFQFREVTPTLEWVAAYIYMIIPLGFLLMTWRTLEVYIKTYRETGSLHAIVQTGGHE